MDFSKINLEMPKRLVNNKRKREDDDEENEDVVC